MISIGNHPRSFFVEFQLRFWYLELERDGQAAFETVPPCSIDINERMMSFVSMDIDPYETIRGTPQDKPIALTFHTSGDPVDEIIFYNKSCLVHYLLDKEIQLKTNHEKNLDDVQRAIYAEYGNYQGHFNPLPLTMDKYIAIINTIT